MAPERSAPHHDALYLSPPKLGHYTRPPSHLDGVLARGGSVDDAAHAALGDAGGAEHVVGDIEVPVVWIDRLAPDVSAVGFDVVALVRNAKRGQVEAAQA